MPVVLKNPVKLRNTDSALDEVARLFKRHGGCVTRQQIKVALIRYPRAVRLAALGQLELVADVEWAKRHGGRPLPGDKFFWPKRRVQA